MSDKPRLLVLTSTLPRFVGDPEPGFVLHLSQALSDQFDVTLLAPMGAGAARHEYIDEVEIHRYRYLPLHRWETLAYPGGIMPRLRSNPLRWLQVPFLIFGLILTIRRLHSERAFDIIHCHWVVPQGLAALLALRAKIRPPIVMTSHGGDLYTLSKGLTHSLLRWVLPRATAITVVSDPLAEVARKLGGENLQRLAMIPMGVATDRFDVSHRKPHWASDLGLHRPVALFVGRLAEKKGVCHLLDALLLEPLSGLEFNLAIVGDGPLRKQLERQAARLGLQDKVHFLGPLSYEHMPVYMASADLLVAPSVNASDGDCEGLPTVILEAMASGTAVLTTPVGGITQAVTDQETGRLVPERDSPALARALADLLSDPTERGRLAANGRRRVQDYSWEHIGNRHAQVLLEAMANSNHERSHVEQ